MIRLIEVKNWGVVETLILVFPLAIFVMIQFVL